jgi:hypothetical protein
MTHLRNNKGQGLVEYTLILVTVVGLVVYLIAHFNQPVQTQINTLQSKITTPGQ